MALEKKPSVSESKSQKKKDKTKKARRAAGTGSRNSTANKARKLIRVFRKYQKLADYADRMLARLSADYGDNPTLTKRAISWSKKGRDSGVADSLRSIARSEFDKACAACKDPIAVLRAQKAIKAD